MLTSDFVHYVSHIPSGPDRLIMLRVALNALHDPDEYPVDFSEILTLRDENRHITQGFLDGCAADPQWYQSWRPDITLTMRAEVADSMGKA